LSNTPLSFALSLPLANVSSLSSPIFALISLWRAGFKAVAYLDFIAESYLPKYWYVDHDYMTILAVFSQEVDIHQ